MKTAMCVGIYSARKLNAYVSRLRGGIVWGGVR